MAGEVRGNINVTIGADAGKLFEALAQSRRHVRSFTDTLAEAATMGAASFITLKEGIFKAVQSFAESEKASKRLEAALLSQGQLTEETVSNYEKIADSLSSLTGASGEAVKGMMASSQAMLGTTKITPELTKAVADLAAGAGISLSEAFEKVSKTIGTQTNALSKNGFVIEESLSKQEKMARVIELIEGRYKGQAQASQTVETALARVGNSFDDLRGKIGERFSPAIERVAKFLDDFFRGLAERPEVLDFIATVGGIAAAVFGAMAAIAAIQSGLTLLAPAFGVLSGAVSAAWSAITAVFAINPIVMGVAAAVAALYLFWKYWDQILPAIQKGWSAFINNVAELGMGLKDVLMGAMTLDASRLLAGIDKIKDAFKKGLAEIKGDPIEPPGVDEKKLTENQKALNESNLKSKQQTEAVENAHAARLAQIERNKTEILRLQGEAGTKDIIALKQRENEILKQLNETRKPEEIVILRDRLDEVKRLETEASQERFDRLQIDGMAENEAKAELQRQGIDSNVQLTQAQQDQLMNMTLTERDAKRQVLLETQKDKIEANNRFLVEQQKYGTAYAAVNRVIHSSEIQGMKEATNELVAMQSSKNSTLKAIGKAAAVSQITIATAESVMNLIAQIQRVIPFPFSIPVQAAMAAARIAFGAEQISSVMGAAQGGIVTGGIPGVDSVPAMLTPGELVVPKQNYEEVIGAVRDSRGGSGDMGAVVSELQAIKERMDQARSNSVVINGDMMGDDVFVDRLIQKISDRLEFGNARLVGVNA